MGACLSTNRAIPSNREIFSSIDNFANSLTVTVSSNEPSEEAVFGALAVQVIRKELSTNGEVLRGVLFNRAKQTLLEHPHHNLDDVVKFHGLNILNRAAINGSNIINNRPQIPY